MPTSRSSKPCSDPEREDFDGRLLAEGRVFARDSASIIPPLRLGLLPVCPTLLVNLFIVMKSMSQQCHSLGKVCEERERELYLL